MENPKISIIIPVYNTEEYVKDAILSIMNQTIKDIEILVINDGSTDNSLQVIQELAKADCRIQIFSQENKGLFDARNKGMEEATGEYLYFMDSDDLLEQKALSSCYEKCEKEQLDLVFFDAEVFGNNTWKQSFFDYHRSEYIETRIYQGTEILNILIDKNIYRSPVWLYLTKRHFVQDIGLTFYPVIHEDQLFTGILYMKAQRVGYIPKAYFKRRLRANSFMTSKYSSLDINAYLIIINQFILHAKHDQSQEIYFVTQKLVRYILNPAIYNSHTLSLSERIEVFKICFRKSYLKFLMIKNIIVILFPFTVALKSYILKRNK